MTVEVCDAVAALEPWLERWDALAVACRQPYSAPGWLLAWWEHFRPPGAQLHVALLADGEALLAVAPFFVHPGRAGRRDLRLLGAGVSHGLGIVSLPGAAAGAANLAAALAQSRPSLVSFEWTRASSDWPRLLRQGWPASIRPASLTTGTFASPSVKLAGTDYPTWLAERSSNFRGQVRRATRDLESARGVLAVASTPAAREAAAVAFTRLHAARWKGRGGSNLPAPTTEAMLLTALTSLPPERLWFTTMEIDGDVRAVQVFVTAGDVTAYWNGGWDETFTRVRPGLLTLVRGIEHAFACGHGELELGGGGELYKLRLTGLPAEKGLASRVLFPVGVRYPQVRLAVLPIQARYATRDWVVGLSPPWPDRARAALRLIGSARRAVRL